MTAAMTSLATTEAAERSGYGVKIRKVATPARVFKVSQNVLGIVGEFPMGPVLTKTKVNTGRTLERIFLALPLTNLATDFIKAEFASLQIVRIVGTGAAKSTKTFPDGSAGDSLVVTAKNEGTYGDQIAVTIAANADDATKNDVTVQLGTLPSYTALAVQNADGTVNEVTDEDFPVTLEAAGGATAKAAPASAVTLESGSDGTVAASHYEAGLDLLAGPSGPNIVTVAAVDSSLVDDVNTELNTFAVENPFKGVILHTKSGQTYSEAITYAAAYAAENAAYYWPMVKRKVNAYNTVQDLTRSGHLIMAALWQLRDPYPDSSPGGFGPGNRNRDYFKARGVYGLENESTLGANLDAAHNAGVSVFFNYPGQGVIVRGACNTTHSITGGGNDVSNMTADWRYKNFLYLTLASFLERVMELPLDLDPAAEKLGPNTAPVIQAMSRFLRGEEKLGYITSGRDEDDPDISVPAFSIDAFSATGNDAISLGQWVILVSIRNAPVMRIAAMRPTIDPIAQTA